HLVDSHRLGLRLVAGQELRGELCDQLIASQAPKPLGLVRDDLAAFQPLAPDVLGQRLATHRDDRFAVYGGQRALKRVDSRLSPSLGNAQRLAGWFRLSRLDRVAVTVGTFLRAARLAASRSISHQRSPSAMMRPASLIAFWLFSR